MAVTLPNTTYAKSGQLRAVASGIGAYLAEGIAPPGPAPNPTHAAVYGEPQGFAGKFPHRVVSLAGGTGQHRERPWLPEWVRFDVRVYDVAVAGAGKQSGAAKANEDVLLSHGAWLEALALDTDFLARVAGLAVEDFEIGIADRFGRYLRDERRNVLWRLQARVSLKL